MAITNIYVLIENFFHNTLLPFEVSSERKGLPGVNVRDPDPSKPHQTTGDSSEWWRLDTSGVNKPNAFALRGHNLTTAASVKVQDDEDIAFGSVGLDATITVPNDPINYGAARLAQTYMATFTEATQRYVRILIADAANPATYLRTGILALGKVAVLKSVDWGWVDAYEDISEAFTSLEGIDYSKPRKKPRIISGRVTFAPLDDKQIIRRISRIGERPTFVSFSPFDNSEKATQTLYGRFRKLPTLIERVHHGYSHTPTNEIARHDYAFEFEEIV